jgi:hypothetical protein
MPVLRLRLPFHGCDNLPERVITLSHPWKPERVGRSVRDCRACGLCRSFLRTMPRRPSGSCRAWSWHGTGCGVADSHHARVVVIAVAWSRTSAGPCRAVDTPCSVLDADRNPNSFSSVVVRPPCDWAKPAMPWARISPLPSRLSASISVAMSLRGIFASTVFSVRKEDRFGSPVK